MNELIDRWWMNEWIDDRWVVDGWMDGWMREWMNEAVLPHKVSWEDVEIEINKRSALLQILNVYIAHRNFSEV